MYQGGIPQASSEPMTEPALVPTMNVRAPGIPAGLLGERREGALEPGGADDAARAEDQADAGTRRVHAADGSERTFPGNWVLMTDQDPKNNPTGNAEKDPSDWVTGEEPMTGAQASYLQTLSQEAGVEFDESLTKAAASERIDELQAKTGRGA